MLQIIGQSACKLLYYISNFLIFTLRAIYHCCTITHFRQLLIQIFRLGYLSLPIIALTAIFSGSVLALQSYIGFARFHAEKMIPEVIALSITREIGPVLVGLIFAGRAGSGICAELGAMKVTEQLDALPTLYTNPFRYLIAPRVIAGIISLPILVLITDIIGIYGGYLVGVFKLNFSHDIYLNQTTQFLCYNDIISGIIKAMVFGFIVTVMGCYCGYHCQGGARGVGQATTRAVVFSSMLILLSNYIITLLFFA